VKVSQSKIKEIKKEAMIMKLILNGGGIGEAVKSARQLLNDLIENKKKYYIFP